MRTAGSTHNVMVVLGPEAPELRRRLGPLAWCALEALHQRATLTESGFIAELSASGLAGELGVAKNTAHRAVKTLRSAGLLEHNQARASGGRFNATSYLLAIPEDVLTRNLVRWPAAARTSPGSRSGAGRRLMAAASVRGFDEQLALLPLA